MRTLKLKYRVSEILLELEQVQPDMVVFFPVTFTCGLKNVFLINPNIVKQNDASSVLLGNCNEHGQMTHFTQNVLHTCFIHVRRQTMLS